jgi:queuine/archaeosine tRNA-ribosyltransferase
MALKKPPDLLIAASDEPDVENPSRKRLHNSVVRSIDWASKCAASLKVIQLPNRSDMLTRFEASPQVPLIVALSGSNSTQARVSFGAQLAQRNDDGSSLDDAVSGYLLRHAPLRALPLENVSSLFKASLDALPAGKLRIASTDAGPHTILHLIRHVGIDLFIDSWAFRMAEIGIALDFDFPPPPSSPSEAALGVNLFDSMHARDFSQLSQSSLAVQSVEKQPALRGYIHHLLWTHEISAHVILALHNVRVIVALLERASRLLASSPDAFDAAADAFAAAYSDDSQLVEQASAHLAQVKDNRGKGRDKRRAAEEAAATLAEAGSSQLVLDGAAQG